MTNDNELLRSFAQSGSESAFSELVSRRLPLVYSAALRQLNGDHDVARDVAQAVFIDLARKANSLINHESITGWLYASTRFAAASVRRSEQRRKTREQSAVMNQPDHDAAETWRAVAPELDEAIHSLKPDERQVILHRFLEGLELREVGAQLGISEDAARMRVTRAVERLHAILLSRGVTLSLAVLASLLATQSIVAAPAGASSSIANASIASAPAAAAISWKVALPLAAALLLGLLFILKSPQQVSVVQESIPPGSSIVPETAPPVASTSAAAPITALVDNSNFQALDALTNGPIEGVKIRLVFFRPFGESLITNLKTDARGNAVLPRPTPPYNSANMFVSSERYVPMSVSFRRNMPEEYTIRLNPGTALGGIVVDEDQRPISGVKIEPQGKGIDTKLRENISFGPDTGFLSDHQGRWFTEMIPASYTSIRLLLTHAGFAPVAHEVAVNKSESTNLVLEMKRGVEITGLVEDWNGQPVRGATIRETHAYSFPKGSATTDAAGRFKLEHVRAAELLLVVQAPDDQPLAPQAREITVSNTPIDLKFTLQPGSLLRGRVTDETDAPIANATIRTAYDSDGLRKIQWSGKTDPQGRFQWRGAPVETLQYTISAEGFSGLSGLLLKADGSEHALKLQRPSTGKPVAITGIVTDAKTRQPIEHFVVLIGDSVPHGSYASPNYSFGGEGRAGRFKLEVERQEFNIQIQKDGYAVYTSTNLFLRDGDQTLEIQLRKGGEIYGLVLMPDLSPAVGAEVFLYDAKDGVYMDKPPRAREGVTRAMRSRADEEGRFSFIQKTEPLGLIAVHEAGFVETSLNDFQSHLVLKPWGRVEGTLRAGKNPLPNEKISLSTMHFRYRPDGRTFPPLALHLETTTDQNGNFTFEKVPPGERAIAHRLTKPGKQTGRIFESGRQPINVLPGSTVRVNLGGQGNTVVGRAVFPTATPANWRLSPVELRLKTAKAPGSFPNRKDFSTNEEFTAAHNKYTATYRDFWMSPEGIGSIRAARSYWTYCSEDGSFRFADIPAGFYEINIELRPTPQDPVAPAHMSLMEPPGIAHGTKTLQVAGDSDLGVIELTPGNSTRF